MENNNNSTSIIRAEGVSMLGVQNNDNDSAVDKSQLLKLRSLNDYSTFEVTGVVPGADAETATLYPIFYAANVRCFFIEARMRHGAAGGAGSRVRIEKLSPGVAKGSGLSMTGSAVIGGVSGGSFYLDGTANIPQWRKATDVLAGLQINPGDAVALRASGTLTNARDVCVTALFGLNDKDVPQGPSVSAVISGI